jgi:hypothetical protein
VLYPAAGEAQHPCDEAGGRAFVDRPTTKAEIKREVERLKKD